MSPDDERSGPRAAGVKEAAGAAASDRADAEPAHDDLEALAGELKVASTGQEAHEADEGLDLGALARVSGPRAANGREDEARVDLGRLGSARPGSNRAPSLSPAPPSSRAEAQAPEPLSLRQASAAPPPPARAHWLWPLLVGLGLGAGLAGLAFGLLRRDLPAQAAAAPPSPQTSALALAAPAPMAPAAALATAPGTPDRVSTALALPSSTTLTPHPAARAPGAGAASHHGLDPGRPGQEAERGELPAPAPSPAPSEGTVLTLRPAAETPAQGAPAVPPPAAEGAPETGASRSMDALLDDALSPSARQAEAEHARQKALATAELPLTPSRDDVTQAMTVLLPAIHGCAMGHTGLATAAMVVRGDGRVANVEVTGAPFAGSASGRCMEGVLRRAHFPRFKQPTFRIRFPLAIQ